jgi:hypothetical protein
MAIGDGLEGVVADAAGGRGVLDGGGAQSKVQFGLHAGALYFLSLFE